MSDSLRECGPCSACCTVIAVHEIEKGAYEPCTHLCASGCGIYGERPGSCRTFECQWLRGALEVDGSIDTAMRPDACAVIFDYQPDTAFGEMYTAWEVEPGASARGHARSIIEGLRESFLVMIVSPDPGGGNGPGERRFVGPPHRVTRADEAMWSRPQRRVPGRRGPNGP
ncbi:MAG: hypothetical protein PVF90_04470 [Gemmatimonadota bacterium]